VVDHHAALHSASDADGNTLAYSTSGTSANGGTVAINPTTGADTFTPTPAQRLAAGTTAAADVDTFTVNVSDGQTTTTGTVPVYVSPTQLNTGTPIAVGNQPGRYRGVWHQDLRHQSIRQDRVGDRH